MAAKQWKEMTRKEKVRRVVGIVSITTIMLVILSLVFGGGSKPKEQPETKAAKFSAGLQPGDTSMQVVNPASLRVFLRVENTGDAEGKPECTILANDSSGTYHGSSTLNKTSPVKPGEKWDFATVLTITKEGAQYVNNVKVEC